MKNTDILHKFIANNYDLESLEAKLNELNDIINKLKESPVFNMSLASKELFHSNFFVWLLNSKKIKGQDKFLRALFPEIPKGDLSDCSVKREAKNLDIWIKLTKVNYNIVIENKVKSIPNKTQLEKYSAALEKIKNLSAKETTCALLSLTKPDFDLDQLNLNLSGYNWQWVSYEKLSQTLEELSSEDAYEQSLITDYKKFIEHLCELQKKCKELWRDERELLRYGGKIYDYFKEIRMHDIYEKWRMETLKLKIKEKIGPDYDDKLIEISTRYTHQQGLLNIYPTSLNSDQDSYFYKIQIQGNKLCQALQIGKPKEEETIFERADDCLKKGQWFLSSDRKPLPERNQKTRTSGIHGFCKYGDTFAYRYENLNEFKNLDAFERIKEFYNNLLDKPNPDLTT